jgi:carbamoyltransferase
MGSPPKPVYKLSRDLDVRLSRIQGCVVNGNLLVSVAVIGLLTAIGAGNPPEAWAKANDCGEDELRESLVFLEREGLIYRAYPRELVIAHSNSFHDSAVAADVDGALFAEALERHTQCKRAWHFQGSATYAAGAVNRWLSTHDCWPVQNRDITFISTWTDRSDIVVADQVASALQLRDYNDRASFAMLKDDARVAVGSCNLEMRRLDHHTSHAAMAALSSPFDECLVLILDGYGEGTSHSWLRFDGRGLEMLEQSDSTASLGALYAAVTELCGFQWSKGHEWKVMGLAAYGVRDPKLYEFFRELIVVDGLKLVRKRNFVGAWSSSWQEITIDEAVSEQLHRLVGGFRKRTDPEVERSAVLARSFQDAFSDIVVELVRNASQQGLSKNLAFGGGCALNSSANGALVASSGFSNLHVPCAPADDGNALGALLHHRHIVCAVPRKPEVLTPYMGSQVSDSDIHSMLSFGKLPWRHIPDEKELLSMVAVELAKGQIIAWVQGRAEFGPRALGNRSILADPRLSEMKDRINAVVKFREKYRPLAPSILHEYGPTYFENYQESPYMDRALLFRQEMRHLVPAVVHADGTGRLQTVKREWNPLFFGLLTEFHKITNVPILVNTSFNVMGKPIVHSVQDALTVFVTTGLDMLVLNNHVVTRPLA